MKEFYREQDIIMYECLENFTHLTKIQSSLEKPSKLQLKVRPTLQSNENSKIESQRNYPTSQYNAKRNGNSLEGSLK